MTIHVYHYQLSNVSYSNSSCSKKTKRFRTHIHLDFFRFGIKIFEYIRAINKIPINLSKIKNKTTF